VIEREGVSIMLIQVTGIEETFHHSVQNIIQLFFEDPQIDFSSEDQKKSNLIIDLNIAGDRFITAMAKLYDKRLNKNYEAINKKDSPVDKTDEVWRKTAKHVLNYALLTVLQDYTGIEQPWGILTGIRPTKLLHQKLKSGLTMQEAGRQLHSDYLIHDKKISLLEQIVDRQLNVIPDLYDLQKGVSIYIGIPFCPTKCAYCTFPAYSIQGQQGSVESFLGGLHYEMQRVGQWLKDHHIPITTIYFGGGTPTSITAEEMDLLYEEMFASFPDVEHVREITVEAGRPDTITPEKLDVLNKWKIDRISINPQSFKNETLKAIGRHHTVEETIEKFHLARQMGMKNINMDLIIGLPGEGIADFAHTLSETKKLMPESVTVHTLSFKRASEMTKNKEAYRVAEREEITEMMKMAEQWTMENAYHPYYLYRQKNILGNLENVGYSLPGRESLYNIIIMEEVQTIIGLGCGAASKWVDPRTGKIDRFANPKEPKAYNLTFQKCTDAKIEALTKLFLDNVDSAQ
jgi:oxygen-independent coproporphyrinogen III oxidase